MSDNTNVYAMQSGTLSFKPTSSGEIRTLIGLHLAMGVMKMPRVSMYWEAKMDIGIFKNTMPRDRFFQLQAHLHLVNNSEKPAEDNDVFFKVRPLYDAIRSRCLELPLEENLCVDVQKWHGLQLPDASRHYNGAITRAQDTARTWSGVPSQPANH